MDRSVTFWEICVLFKIVSMFLIYIHYVQNLGNFTKKMEEMCANFGKILGEHKFCPLNLKGLVMHHAYDLRY